MLVINQFLLYRVHKLVWLCVADEFTEFSVVCLRHVQTACDSLEKLKRLGCLAFGKQSDLQLEVRSLGLLVLHATLDHENGAGDHERLQR